MAKGVAPHGGTGVSVQTARPWRSQPAGRRFAAIDIGSDTVHMLIAEVAPDSPRIRTPLATRRLTTIHSESELLELGKVVGRTGRITTPAEKSVGQALERMVRRATKSGATILISATEASRRATNGQDVLDRLSARLKTPIRLLTPEREAELGFAGVRADLPTRGELVVVDSGGASTEVTLTRGRQFQRATSLPVGAARLATQLVGDPPDPIDWALVAVSIGATLPSLPAGKPRHAYATGGTAHGLLAVGTLAVSHSAADRATISLAELDRIAGLLLDRPSRRIGAAAQVDPRRVALLAPGILIIGAILRHYGLSELTVVRAGVREGMIRAAAADPSHWWLDPAKGFPPVAAAPPAAVPQPVGPIAAS
jgi:exopolyphosphatase / guanosine-5'-triphosphate,3'-diphosphate pyrophosphatase